MTNNFSVTNGWSGWTVAGVFGMGGSFVFPLLGALILKAAESGGDVSPAMQKFTDIVSLLCIPLLIFGSFCFNKNAGQVSVKRDNYGSPDSKIKSL